MKWRKAMGDLTVIKVELNDLLDDYDLYLKANAIDIADGTLINFEDAYIDDFILDKDGNEYTRLNQLYGNEFRGSFEYQRRRSNGETFYMVRNVTFLMNKWLKEAGVPLEDYVEKRELKWNMYEYQGEERTLNTIAKMNDVTYQSLKTRLDKGMSLDEAIEAAKARRIYRRPLGGTHEH